MTSHREESDELTVGQADPVRGDDVGPPLHVHPHHLLPQPVSVASYGQNRLILSHFSNTLRFVLLSSKAC